MIVLSCPCIVQCSNQLVYYVAAVIRPDIMSLSLSSPHAHTHIDHLICGHMALFFCPPGRDRNWTLGIPPTQTPTSSWLIRMNVMRLVNYLSWCYGLISTQWPTLPQNSDGMLELRFYLNLSLKKNEIGMKFDQCTKYRQCVSCCHSPQLRKSLRLIVNA